MTIVTLMQSFADPAPPPSLPDARTQKLMDLRGRPARGSGLPAPPKVTEAGPDCGGAGLAFPVMSVGAPPSHGEAQAGELGVDDSGTTSGRSATFGTGVQLLPPPIRRHVVEAAQAVGVAAAGGLSRRPRRPCDGDAGRDSHASDGGTPYWRDRRRVRAIIRLVMAGVAGLASLARDHADGGLQAHRGSSFRSIRVPRREEIGAAEDRAEIRGAGGRSSPPGLRSRPPAQPRSVPGPVKNWSPAAGPRSTAQASRVSPGSRAILAARTTKPYATHRVPALTAVLTEGTRSRRRSRNRGCIVSAVAVAVFWSPPPRATPGRLGAEGDVQHVDDERAGDGCAGADRGPCPEGRPARGGPSPLHRAGRR